MSVNTLWTLITNYPMEGRSQQVNLEANSIRSLISYIGTQLDLTQVTTLRKKSEAQPLS